MAWLTFCVLTCCVLIIASMVAQEKTAVMIAVIAGLYFINELRKERR